MIESVDTSFQRYANIEIFLPPKILAYNDQKDHNRSIILNDSWEKHLRFFNDLGLERGKTNGNE
jgi:hypothetical protein